MTGDARATSPAEQRDGPRRERPVETAVPQRDAGDTDHSAAISNPGHAVARQLTRLQGAAGNAAVGALIQRSRAATARPSTSSSDPTRPAAARGAGVPPQRVGPLVGEPSGAPSPLQRSILDDVMETASDVADAVSGAASSAAGAVGEAAEGVVEGVEEGAKAVGSAAEGAADTVAGAAKEVGETVGDVATGVGEKVKSTAGEAWNGLKETASDVGKTVEDTASSTWDAVKGAAGDLADGVSDMAGKAWEGVKEAASEATSGVSDAAKGVWSAVSEAADDTWNGIKGAAADAWSAVSDAASGAWDTVKETASDLADKAKELAQEAWQGIKAAAGAAWNWVKDGLSSLWASVMDHVDKALEAVAQNVPKPGENVRSRGLSEDEIFFAKRVFADSIDYSKIVVTRGSLLSAGAPRTTGNTINMTDEYFDGDTLNLTGKGVETLVHEMTHVKQFQTGGLGYIPESLWAQAKAWWQTGSRNAAYDWEKADADGTPWEEWNPEQQAEAVEDYNKELHKQELGEPYDADKLAKLQKYVGKMRAGPTKSAGGTGSGGGTGGAGPPTGGGTGGT